MRIIDLPLIATLAASTALSPVWAAELPTNGSIKTGTGTISQNGDNLTITQTTDSMSIDWDSFSVGEGGTVTFDQPTTTSVTLNRVTGQTASVIQGRITAIGQVFLVNPNGVLFSTTSQVDVGGLVASTLDISDDDLTSGTTTLSGDSTAEVRNEGTIRAAKGGLVAMVAARVINTGSIDVEEGNVLLGSGSQVVIDVGGPARLQVDQGVLDGLIENGGAIRANGGFILLTAKALNTLTSSTISNTGVIEARTLAKGKDGRILLMGDMDVGQTNVAGTLDASAPDEGDGGFIETSAANVRVLDDASVTTASASGDSGLWLIDPTNFQIASGNGSLTNSTIGATTLQNSLANGSVTIQTSNATNGGDKGDITVNSSVTWSTSNTLTLRAHNDIKINANVTGTNGTLVLTNDKPGNGTVTQTGAISVATLTITSGKDVTLENANNDFDTLSINTGGFAKIKDKDGLTLGNISAAKYITLTAAGDVTQSANTTLATSNGTNSITLTSGNLTLGSTSLAGALTISTNGTISQRSSTTLTVGGDLNITAGIGSVTLGDANVTGLLAISTNATVTQTSGTTWVFGNGTSTLAAGSGNITIGTATFGGALTATTTGAFLQNAGTTITTGGNTSINATSGVSFGTMNVTGTLGLIANGSIAQAANTTLTVSGATTLAAGVGNITLGAAALSGALTATTTGAFLQNAGTTITTGGNTSINATSGVSFGTMNVTGTLGLIANGSIAQAASTTLTVSGATTVAAGVGNITLGAGSLGGALSASGTGGFVQRDGTTLTIGGNTNITVGSYGISIGTANVTGTLRLSTTGTVTQNASSTLKSSGAATILAGSGGIALGEADFGTLTLNTTGAITQAASTALKVNGTATLTGSEIMLANSGNTIKGAIDATGGNITLSSGVYGNATTGLTLGTLNATGKLDLVATSGNLLAEGAITSGSTDVNAISISSEAGNVEFGNRASLATGTDGGWRIFTGSLVNGTYPNAYDPDIYFGQNGTAFLNTAPNATAGDSSYRVFVRGASPTVTLTASTTSPLSFTYGATLDFSTVTISATGAGLSQKTLRRISNAAARDLELNGWAASNAVAANTISGLETGDVGTWGLGVGATKVAGFSFTLDASFGTTCTSVCVAITPKAITAAELFSEASKGQNGGAQGLQVYDKFYDGTDQAYVIGNEQSEIALGRDNLTANFTVVDARYLTENAETGDLTSTDNSDWDAYALNVADIPSGMLSPGGATGAAVGHQKLVGIAIGADISGERARNYLFETGDDVTISVAKATIYGQDIVLTASDVTRAYGNYNSDFVTGDNNTDTTVNERPDERYYAYTVRVDCTDNCLNVARGTLWDTANNAAFDPTAFDNASDENDAIRNIAMAAYDLATEGGKDFESALAQPDTFDVGYSSAESLASSTSSDTDSHTVSVNRNGDNDVIAYADDISLKGAGANNAFLSANSALKAFGLTEANITTETGDLTILPRKVSLADLVAAAGGDTMLTVYDRFYDGSDQAYARYTGDDLTSIGHNGASLDATDEQAGLLEFDEDSITLDVSIDDARYLSRDGTTLSASWSGSEDWEVDTSNISSDLADIIVDGENGRRIGNGKLAGVSLTAAGVSLLGSRAGNYEIDDSDTYLALSTANIYGQDVVLTASDVTRTYGNYAGAFATSYNVTDAANDSSVDRPDGRYYSYTVRVDCTNNCVTQVADLSNLWDSNLDQEFDGAEYDSDAEGVAAAAMAAYGDAEDISEDFNTEITKLSNFDVGYSSAASVASVTNSDTDSHTVNVKRDPETGDYVSYEDDISLLGTGTDDAYLSSISELLDFGLTEANVVKETGDLTITPRLVSAAADNKVKYQGEVDPVLTYSETSDGSNWNTTDLDQFGFVNGNSWAALGTSISRVPGETVGDYVISIIASILDGNYEFDPTDAILTIMPAAPQLMAPPMPGAPPAPTPNTQPPQQLSLNYVESTGDGGGDGGGGDGGTGGTGGTGDNQNFAPNDVLVVNGGINTGT